MKRYILFSLAILILLAPSARATTLVRLSLEQLSQAATLVVRGRVLTGGSRWNQAHTQIVTRTTVQVTQSVKGAPPTLVAIEQPGGTVGNVHVRVAGTVFFNPQDEFYFFLEPARGDASGFLLVGMLQGAYRIVRDPTNGEERVIHPLSGLGVSQRGLLDEAGRAAVVPEPMFRRELQSALARPPEIPRGTALPVVVMNPPTRCSGVWRVFGETTADVFPNSRVVVPAGSAVEGTAELASGRWKIHWREISLRGAQVTLDAVNEQPAKVPLSGSEMLIVLR
jgi:hypothetical protein